jgi:Trk K+ transport system NAD-binding subunit
VSRTVVLCGLGRVGWRVLESLRSTGASVTVIELNARDGDPRLTGVTVIRGDCRHPEVLDRAGVRAASGVLVVTSDDLVNVATVLAVRKLNPDVRIVVRMFNQNLITRLGAIVKNTVALSVSALTAPLLALAAVSGESLAAFAVGPAPQQLTELTIDTTSPVRGERIADVAARFRVLVIAYTPASGGLQLLVDVPGDAVLADGDRLVVCGSPHAIETLTSDGKAIVGVLWAGGVRRLVRTVRRTVAAVDTPVQLASVVLFVSLLVSCLVFRFGVGSTWADSLYQTVSVVATGAELHGEDKPGWVKVFLSVLKLTGAALIAGFTAIFTNYLLKARLRGAFEERRIPDGGHVVVCGLGNIGYRCVQELLRLGVKVVAIERAADNPFAATVRRMGAAVVAGDATVPEVLSQARAGTARAVIAATASELVNLEVALLVRELNPTQRVVVRIADPDFAQAVRDAADIRLALSPPALAGPAFATALLGDRVQALAPIGDRTIALVELIADPGDELCDRTIHELMVDYHFLPLGVAGAEPFAETGVTKGHRMKVGEKLIAAIDLKDLERMLRREPPAPIWSVLIDDFPISARGELESLIRTARGCTTAEAQAMLAGKGFAVLERTNRGRAEELVSRLVREKVTARVVSAQT